MVLQGNKFLLQVLILVEETSLFLNQDIQTKLWRNMLYACLLWKAFTNNIKLKKLVEKEIRNLQKNERPDLRTKMRIKFE